MPSTKYGVIIERWELGFDVQDWSRRALGMLREMVCRWYYLAMRKMVRESNPFCSVVSSAMGRLYRRAFKKMTLSLRLSE